MSIAFSMTSAYLQLVSLPILCSKGALTVPGSPSRHSDPDASCRGLARDTASFPLPPTALQCESQAATGHR